MNPIESQILQAKRRLQMQTFGRVVSWTLFIWLSLACIAWCVPKIHPLRVDLRLWNQIWLVGVAISGLITAIAWTWWKTPSTQEAARQVDQRFQLRERLSSAVQLSSRDRETLAGQALLDDAQRAASRINIPARFELQPTRTGLLPLIPISMLAVLFLVPNAQPDQQQPQDRSVAARAEAEQVLRTATELKKRLLSARDLAQEKGLTDAEELFNQLDRKLDKLVKRDDVDRKQAMIAINDIKQTLDKRREQLGTPEQMRKSLANLDKLEKGPADRVAQALQEGDFAEAKEQVKDLTQKLRDDQLSQQERQQLQQQVQQLQQKLQEAKEQYDQAKQDLQRQMEQAKQEGRLADADRMQQKLNDLERKQDQMDQLQTMAERLQQASEAMQQGNDLEAADALDELSEELGQMQQDLDELEDLESALEQLDQAKDQMRHGDCEGGNCPGCAQCQGDGNGTENRTGQGPGIGRGIGPGTGPESEIESNTYQSRVGAKPQGGRAVVTGVATGENRKGVTREELQEVVRGALSEASDPVETQVLPRTEREHVQQYLDALREGK